MQRWLLKTEPGDYSWNDLEADRVTQWDGVGNAAALKNMRSMKTGDPVLIYHTGREKAIVGTGRVIKEAYPDPEENNERLIVVDIEVGEKLKRSVTLGEIKASGRFPGWELVRMPRLSVVPVNTGQWEQVIEWAGQD